MKMINIKDITKLDKGKLFERTARKASGLNCDCRMVAELPKLALSISELSLKHEKTK